MGQFDNMPRRECVVAAADRRHDIHAYRREYSESENLDARREELRLREELVEIWQRLLRIEVEERDACSVALQKATLEAEEARAKT